mmetsp:Transcript_6541/g.13701  ORF Transcript_6541/g.13701 Transcript_6541/m.13701 type:complete len:272 (+) Transcript_6541:758-1573(+)
MGQQHGAKDFAPLLVAMRNATKFGVDGDDVAKRAAVYEAYGTAFRDAWERNRSVVFGAEAINYTMKEDIDGDAIVQDLMGVSPRDAAVKSTESPRGKIAVMVAHRLPRVEHLVSLWHQLRRGSQPLSDFVVLDLINYGFMMNSLGLTAKFLEKGLPVVLINTEDATRRGLLATNVVACDVLGVPCNNATKTIRAAPDLAIFANKRANNEGMDLDRRWLGGIDDILNKFDCRFWHLLLTAELLEVLPLRRIFDSCGKGAQDVLFPFQALSRK